MFAKHTNLRPSGRTLIIVGAIASVVFTLAYSTTFFSSEGGAVLPSAVASGLIVTPDDHYPGQFAPPKGGHQGIPAF